MQNDWIFFFCVSTALSKFGFLYHAGIPLLKYM